MSLRNDHQSGVGWGGVGWPFVRILTVQQSEGHQSDGVGWGGLL